MDITYDKAFERVIGHEGNFQDDPRDRGNWVSGEIKKGELKGTKFGISAMSYPDLDIENLTLEDAKAIYKRDFWNRCHADKLDHTIVYQLFDAAINHGVGNAIRMLQRSVNAIDDGLVGPKTLAAIASYSTSDMLKLFLAERLEFMTRLSTFNTYGRGWSRRIADNLRYAAQDTIE